MTAGNLQMTMFLQCLECGSHRLGTLRQRTWVYVVHPGTRAHVEVIGDVYRCLDCGSAIALVPWGEGIQILPVVKAHYETRGMS